jgi:O-antigen/teichoic acid export membrane protein
MTLLGMAFALFVVGFAKLALVPVFGAKYSASRAVLMILAIAVPIRFCSVSLAAALFTRGNIRLKVVVEASVALFNVILVVIALHYFGLIGVAVATVLAEVLLLFSVAIAMRARFVLGNSESSPETRKGAY